MNALKIVARPRAPGTVDLRYDFHDDIVFARARWSLETSADVMRWYELHARFFASRFSRPKDLVSVLDAFEVSPSMESLWERYSIKLLETVVRFSATVSGQPRSSRIAIASSAPRLHVQTIETGTVTEAVAAILTRRQTTGQLRTPSTQRARALSVDGPPSGSSEPEK